MRTTGDGIGKLDDETLARLRARAAHHGVSMEEEAWRILRDAVSGHLACHELAFSRGDSATGRFHLKRHDGL
jgi:plasmid stability protein